MTRLEIAARILAAMLSRNEEESRWDGVTAKQAENPSEARWKYCLRQADGLISEELATRAKPPHVHEFPARWEWDGKPGRNIKRYCKCGQVEFGAIGEP